MVTAVSNQYAVTPISTGSPVDFLPIGQAVENAKTQEDNTSRSRSGHHCTKMIQAGHICAL